MCPPTPATLVIALGTPKTVRNHPSNARSSRGRATSGGSRRSVHPRTSPVIAVATTGSSAAVDDREASPLPASWTATSSAWGGGADAPVGRSRVDGVEAAAVPRRSAELSIYVGAAALTA
jgi:hypothetical protein